MPDKVIDIPGVGSVAFPDAMSDAEINAAATRLYQGANPSKKQPPVKSWVDTAMDWLPTVGGMAGAAISSETGPGMIGGAAVGGMVGDALKQGINKLRGADVPQTATGALGEMAGESATNAAVAGAGVAGRAALPAIGRGLETAGVTLSSGGEALRDLLAHGWGWKAQLGKIAIPPLAKAGGATLQIVGKAAQALGGEGEAAVAKKALQARLARMPLQARLEAIGAERAAEPVAKSALDSLPDDVALIRESIGMQMAPETAIRIVANGDKTYYDALKSAFLKSVKDEGMPPPKAVSDLLKLPAFQKLPKP